MEDFLKLGTQPNRRKWVQGLQAALFTGPAKGLTARRWWAAGTDFTSWQLREHAYTVGDLDKALYELAGPGIRPTTSPEKVVVVDIDLHEVGLANFEDAIQIHPPGWASEAADPWMRRDEAANDPVAKTMVDLTELSIVS